MAHTTRRGDNAGLCMKDQDNCDRFDSGIESYNSLQSYDGSLNTSLQSPIDVDSVSTQISSITLSTTAATTSIDDPIVHDLRFDDKKGEITEDCVDSGYVSYKSLDNESLPSNSVQDSHGNLEPEKDPETQLHPFVKCFIPDADGDTYLQLAIIKRKLDIAFNIIQMCNVPVVLDVANAEQQTALHLTVLTNQPSLTRCLVAYGANVRCKDKLGNTPLHIACERGLLAHVIMLTTKLDEKEDPGLQMFDLPQNVNERNYLGFTPLHIAVMSNRTDIVQYLINALKCDVNVPDLKSGRTALHHAIERRSMDVIKLILSARASVDALTYDECSPLHLAAARGLRPEASALIKNGADIFLVTRDDQDVFDLSANNPRLYRILRDAEKRHREGLHGLQPAVTG